MKTFFISLFFIFFIFVQSSFAQVENIGIIKGIWFSDTEFIEGETMRVYTAIQNNSGGDVEGSIEFYRGNSLLGTKKFSALNNRIIESWVDTEALAGTHEFSVKIIKTTKNPIGVDSVEIVAQSIFSESVAVIKKDTDRDSIPDDIDEDDDGDGITDILEKEKNTDPLDKNSFPKKEEKESSEKGDDENTLAEEIRGIINSLVKSDSNVASPDFEVVDLVKKESIDVNKNTKQEKIIENTPDIVLDYSKDSELLRSLVLQISTLQEKTHTFAEGEKEKNSQKVAELEGRGSLLHESADNPEGESSNIAESPRWKAFIFWFYGVILSLLEIATRHWWFMVVLMFAGVYVLIKILFKIFAKKSDY